MRLNTFENLCLLAYLNSTTFFGYNRSSFGKFLIDISRNHASFVKTGQASPRSQMIYKNLNCK